MEKTILSFRKGKHAWGQGNKVNSILLKIHGISAIEPCKHSPHTDLAGIVVLDPLPTPAAVSEVCLTLLCCLITPHFNLDLLKYVCEVLCNAYSYLFPTPFSLSKREMLSLIHSFQLLQLDCPAVFILYHLCILGISQHSRQIKIFARSDTKPLQFSFRHESHCPCHLRSDFRIWLKYISSKTLSYLLTHFQH